MNTAYTILSLLTVGSLTQSLATAILAIWAKVWVALRATETQRAESLDEGILTTFIRYRFGYSLFSMSLFFESLTGMLLSVASPIIAVVIGLSSVTICLLVAINSMSFYASYKLFKAAEIAEGEPRKAKNLYF